MDLHESHDTPSAASGLAQAQTACCGASNEQTVPVSRTIHMCMSVRGAIRNLQKQRGKKTYMTDDAGRPLSKEQAIDALMDELTKGHETIPMGPKCGNPCGQAGCTGFDYGEHGGCAGYVTSGEVAL